MTPTIPDQILRGANLTEEPLFIEIACHLFEKQRLTQGPAVRLSEVSRTAFESKLLDSKIPIYRWTLEEFEKELQRCSRPLAER